MLKKSFADGGREAGCDEAGRGCLAGPVFAAAVILPPGFRHPLLNDSKQVREADRIELRTYIESRAICFAVAQVGPAEIDRINILRASIKAMHLALDELPLRPSLILVDGNHFVRYHQTKHLCIVKGDSIYASIAAASILAKTYRDEYMINLHSDFPQYGWDHNKGYATETHRLALAQHGECVHHRRSFHWQDPQLSIDI